MGRASELVFEENSCKEGSQETECGLGVDAIAPEPIEGLLVISSEGASNGSEAEAGKQNPKGKSTSQRSNRCPKGIERRRGTAERVREGDG